MPQSQDPVDAFRDLAEAFCALVEHAEEHDAEEILRRLSVLLPDLLVGVKRLPELEPTPDFDAPEIGHAAWSERFGALNEALGDRGGYWTTMDVHAAEEPAVVGLPIADDLADIWRDLRGGLDAVAASGDIADAVWEWRFNSGIHWGAHAVEALRAVHGALHDRRA